MFMNANIGIEQVTGSLHNQAYQVLYFIVGIFIAICIGQTIHRIIKKKKSAIIWLLMAILTPRTLPFIFTFIKSIASGNIIILLGFIFILSGIIITIGKLYKETVLFLDDKK